MRNTRKKQTQINCWLGIRQYRGPDQVRKRPAPLGAVSVNVQPCRWSSTTLVAGVAKGGYEFPFLSVITVDRSSVLVLRNRVPVDLNCLTVPGSLHLIYTNDINDSGGITGQASDPDHGKRRVFLATPVVGSKSLLGIFSTKQQ